MDGDAERERERERGARRQIILSLPLSGSLRVAPGLQPPGALLHPRGVSQGAPPVAYRFWCTRTVNG
jgi:hypothetical protein